MPTLTPMMEQYKRIKDKHRDSILFFRLGDFYEMFWEDAKIAARILDIALTSREAKGRKIPMAGIPYHSSSSYISRLIEAGYSIAICEQVEDASEASGLVDREVVRIITPGTGIDDDLLEEKQNNYLCALAQEDNIFGFTAVDISTGEFMTTEMDGASQDGKNGEIMDEMDRLVPAEALLASGLSDTELADRLSARDHLTVKDFPEYELTYDEAYGVLTDHFGTVSLEGFGLENKPAAVISAATIILYLRETQKNTLAHISGIRFYSVRDHMIVDSITRRNLELTETIREGKKKGSLLWVLDETITAMGGRLLRRWLERPLLDVNTITKRHEMIAELVDKTLLRSELRSLLESVYDIERLSSRLVYESANARDLVSLKQSLAVLPEIRELVQDVESPGLRELEEKMDTLEDVVDLIARAIKDDPQATLTEGGIIREGFNREVDRLREAGQKGKDWIAELEVQERERTGINSLKVGYNKVFGYYIEVTNPNLDRVPDNYIRKQTLSNSERFFTPELKDKESAILGAEEKVKEIEYELFCTVRDEIAEELERIQGAAQRVARLDLLSTLAQIAIDYNYTKPEVRDTGQISITGGRHPVVEQMALDEFFVPNDTQMDTGDNRFIILTGPNMSGKSTYMRQVALIVLLAQMGSFVPAEEAEIGICDRIFTRVGAADDLTTGQSTFMVEMNEVSNILHNATDKSLIILDEVGRGTSTFDGLSIAWAVVEYIHDPEVIGARTLFATHYHELTVLEEELSGIKNYNIAVEEKGDDVLFLREIVPGGTDDSYGIQVARLAGLPPAVIQGAWRILEHLEGQRPALTVRDTEENEDKRTEDKRGDGREAREDRSDGDSSQLKLFDFREHPVVEEIRELDLLNTTPLEALNQLYRLKKLISEEIEGHQNEGETDQKESKSQPDYEQRAILDE